MPHTPQYTLPLLTGPEILAKLTTILVELLHVEPEQVVPEAYFMKVLQHQGQPPSLGADSLDQLEILMACETEFGLSIPDADMEKLFTVQNAVDYLLAHKVF